MDNWYDYQNNDINAFIKAYRESLQAQRDSSIKQLNQARKNYFGSIMGGANRRGMMYSNFPQRDKIIYDTSAYNPAYIKANTTYQTGLDTLRNNAISLWNKIKAYQEAISDLNVAGGTGGIDDTEDEDEEEERKKSAEDGNGGAGYSSLSGANGAGYVGGGGGGGGW